MVFDAYFVYDEQGREGRVPVGYVKSDGFAMIWFKIFQPSMVDEDEFA
jgi:hypothetical protein